MPSFGGGGGQTVPSTYSQGGNPAAYIPTAQPTADVNYQSLLQGLINPSLSFLNQGQSLPAAQNYPEAQYLSNLVTQNPYFGQAQQAVGLQDQYGQAAGQGAYYAGMNTFPFLAGNVTGLFPDLQSSVRGILSQAPGIASQTRAPIAALQGSGNQILSTAFDPQQALYNQQLQQNQDAVNAQNAMSGLAGSPYAAGLANQANQNFNNQWLNQQLSRQAAGLGAAGSAFQTAGGLNTSAMAQLASALQSGSQGATAAGNLEAQGAALLGQGYNLANTGAGWIGNAGSLPYQQLNQFADQGTTALNNLINIGNNQYQIPMQTLNYLANYLKLGQGASELSGQLGNLGASQQNTGFGNTLALAGLGNNALFGSAGPFGGSGLIGGLFGGGQGFPDASLFGDIGTAGAAPFAFGATDAAAGGGVDLASALLPFAFL